VDLAFGRTRILVPVDFSDASFDALRRVVTASTARENITVVHAIAPLSATAPGAIWQTIDDETLVANATATLKRRIGDAGAEGVGVVVTVGTPGEVVVETARARGAELVVIASHGRTGVERWLLGSVAERVVREAPCPVLVLRR
jgi:nucleotide-binding universal stress UspA family protein